MKNMAIKIIVRYPPGREDRARRVASLFRHPQVVVELAPGGAEIVVVGPMFATTDLTLATALARRLLLEEVNKK